ncbi:hypothetical protein KAZ66_05245, partial [Candidatus Woesebacteria bacterium]|nr:hypothetical protein [Candidatus Woesebacteria bacterium]
MSIVQQIKQLVYPFFYKEKIVYIPENRAFDGKIIMLAGGTGAVGEAICEMLYKQGASIAVVGRSADKLSALKNSY